jgi:hypothetical protein
MPDLTMCEGASCPLKDTCYRYKAVANEFRQSYFSDLPYNKDEEKCDYYFPNKIMNKNYNLNLER